MIANLLEAHQERQNQPLAANPIDIVKLLGEIVDRLLVKRCLLTAELAKGFHFGLIGQVGNH